MFRILLYISSVLFITSQSFACSLWGSYKTPSGFELVQLSDSVVVAKILGKSTNQEKGYAQYLEAEVIDVLKGPRPDKIYLSGDIGGQEVSPEFSIVGSIFGAGSCSRYQYKKGSTVIVTLEETSQKGIYQSFSFPFARNAEDIKNTKSPWYIAVKKYIEIQSNFIPVEQIKALENWQNDLLDQPTSKTNTALLESIHSHLYTPSRYHPTELLIENYQQALDGKKSTYQIPEKMLDRLSTSYKKYIYININAPLMPRHEEDKLSYQQFILEELSQGEHPTAYPLVMKELSEPDDLHLVPVLIKYLINHDKLTDALDMFEKYLLLVETLHDTSFRNKLSGAFTALSKKFTETKLDKSNALRLYSIYNYYSQKGVQYWSGNFLPILQAIRPENYEENPYISIALAREKDTQIIAWAKKELQPEFNGEMDKLPVQILVNSVSKIDDPNLTAFLCSTTPRRQIAFKAMLKLENDYGFPKLLLQSARLTNLGSDDKKELIKTVRQASLNRHWARDTEIYENILRNLITSMQPKIPDKMKNYNEINCNAVKDNSLFIP